MTRKQPLRDLTFGNSQRQWSRDDEAALRVASLSSPAFEESWQAGSPLDWTEFIARWQSLRSGPVDAVTVRSKRVPGT
jgi:hypothetical protein